MKKILKKGVLTLSLVAMTSQVNASDLQPPELSPIAEVSQSMEELVAEGNALYAGALNYTCTTERGELMKKANDLGEKFLILSSSENSEEKKVARQWFEFLDDLVRRIHKCQAI